MLIGVIYFRMNVGPYIVIFPYIELFVAHYLFFLFFLISDSYDLTQRSSFQTFIYHY